MARKPAATPPEGPVQDLGGAETQTDEVIDETQTDEVIDETQTDEVIDETQTDEVIETAPVEFADDLVAVISVAQSGTPPGSIVHVRAIHLQEMVDRGQVMLLEAQEGKTA